MITAWADWVGRDWWPVRVPGWEPTLDRSGARLFRIRWRRLFSIGCPGHDYGLGRLGRSELVACARSWMGALFGSIRGQTSPCPLASAGRQGRKNGEVGRRVSHGGCLRAFRSMQGVLGIQGFDLPGSDCAILLAAEDRLDMAAIAARFGFPFGANPGVMLP